MKTVAEWIRKHPGVKAQMFERNHKKESGSGKFEAVCGFCLASHYFRGKATTQLPILCGSISGSEIHFKLARDLASAVANNPDQLR